MKAAIIHFVLLLCGNLAFCQNITTVACGNTGHGGYYGDGGPATDAEMGYVGGIAIDNNGNIYIGDGNNHRLRRVNVATGIIETICGTGVGGYNGDNIPATSAQLNGPGYVTLDHDQNIYVGEEGNRVRKINKSTGLITTFAGNGILGTSGDGGPATSAQITIGDFAFDPSGNMIMGDLYCIRKISTSGIITKVAGTGVAGPTAEGVTATSTTLSMVQGLCVDRFGNIFFTDGTASVRKITASTGIMTRVAGTADSVGVPYTGDNIPATTCHISPFGVAVDDTGNLYIADYGNNRIEKVDVHGIIHTIAGTGVGGYSGDGGPAINAQIYYPENAVLDKCNNVYIADFNNKAIRKITYRTSCVGVGVNEVSSSPNPSIFPNPTSSILHIDNPSPQTSFLIANPVGSIVQQGDLSKGNNNVDISRLAIGIYLLHLIDGEGNHAVYKVIKQ